MSYAGDEREHDTKHAVLPSLSGPCGELVEYDRPATEVAYLSFREEPRTCLGCRNYRAAFEPAWLEAPVREACSTLGIDPFAAIETTFYNIDAATGLAVYSGEYPFVGRLIAEVVVHESVWGFARDAHRPEFGGQHPTLFFSLLLPWTLSEPPTT